MNNKTRFQEWVVIFALIIWVFLTIASCARLWNLATNKVDVGGFFIGTSIATVLITAVVAFFIGKRTWDKYGKMSIEETQTKKK